MIAYYAKDQSRGLPQCASAAYLFGNPRSVGCARNRPATVTTICQPGLRLVVSGLPDPYCQGKRAQERTRRTIQFGWEKKYFRTLEFLSRIDKSGLLPMVCH